MKQSLILALVLLNFLTISPSFAQSGKKTGAAPKKTISNKNVKLETSFKFDGSALRGKYQTSLNTTATVENDKFLEDLLGGRTQFEDRIQKDQERN